MKPKLLTIVLMLFHSVVFAQITTPVVRANFGVDAELRANVLYSSTTSSDDWFLQGTLPGSGTFIIDTTGAAAIMARYATDINFRKLPFTKRMRFPEYTVVSGRLLVDALFTRDFHGMDSTMFANGASKNGMSPVDWTTPVAQSVPDKNEILDMMMHVRRAGVNPTDSLWLFGGVSIENVTGDRYFDFEMYQTDITYDRPNLRFTGYGPDAGHTSWKFNAAGQVTQPGDIIFTAEFGTSGLQLLEARIWIDRASLSITPAGFSWGGLFDGAANGVQFGYANILPKTAGDFYTGLSSALNTWPGPFGLVLGANGMPATYIAKQYMEFSVNLTKLGLDPVTLMGGSICGKPFRKVMTKTRTSNSFTSSLKDFVGPFDMFKPDSVSAATDFNFYCGVYGVSELVVTNPNPNSIYNWTTTNGNIVSQSSGVAYANAPGTYIVSQRLMSVCPIYTQDTIQINFDPNCSILDDNIINFRGKRDGAYAMLKWDLVKKEGVKGFIIERSTDGQHFAPTGSIIEADPLAGLQYVHKDDVSNIGGNFVYYRLRVTAINGQSEFSGIIRVALASTTLATGLHISPNPVKDQLNLVLDAEAHSKAQWSIFDAAGKLIVSNAFTLNKGTNQVKISDVKNLKNGYYMLRISVGEKTFSEKFLILK
ncbi:T9SS type A sorting domain-containing protein [Pollutibacter soli]|uniref:T9SS type A sorting domain-containing protein n=1 Tax=Pollutibacter soli TaxID=3034157 RepID=UPI0030141C22